MEEFLVIVNVGDDADEMTKLDQDVERADEVMDNVIELMAKELLKNILGR